MKTLSISKKSNGVVTITVSKELSNFYKKILYISSKQEQDYSEKLSQLSKNLKSITGFNDLTIDFGGIDYYDEAHFEVPYFTFIKGSKKPTIGHCSWEVVPKEWTENITLKLTEVKSIRGINKFLSELGINLNDENLNKIRKILKSELKYVEIQL